MADAPSLGAFFAKKKKNAAKGTNLNNQAANPKAEEKKTKTKDKEEEGWEDEQVVAPTMMVAVAGALAREEEPADAQESSAPAWGRKKDCKNQALNERKYPSLAKSVSQLGQQSSNINLDDGSKKHINIKTTKNAFSALDDEDNDDSDDEARKKPTHIKPAMVSKQKGEFAKHAIQREVDKYVKKGDSKSGGKHADDDSEDEEEAAAARKAKRKEKKASDKSRAVEEEEEVEEDVKIKPNLEASRAKYFGREKLETVELSRKELEEEKENKKPAPAASKSKKKRYVEEEEDEKPKLLVADWD